MGSGVVAACVLGGVAAFASVAALTTVMFPDSGTLRSKFPYSVTVIGHRGGSILGPENTMYTFEKAVRGGANMLELDVRLTKDGKVVVSHDNDLQRTCGEAYANKTVKDITADTLPQSARSIPVEFKSPTATDYVADESIPVDDSTRLCLLEDVFLKFPTTPLHIDIKETGAGIVNSVLDMISQYGRGAITFVGTSNSANLPFIRDYFVRAGPAKRKEFRLFAGAPQVIRTYLLFYSGLLPFTTLDYDVFSIPILTSSMQGVIAAEFGSALGFGASFLLNSPTLWKHLQKRGVSVLGWVVNDPVDFQQAIAWPLNGVMSDDPIALKAFIDNNSASDKLVRLGQE